MKHPIFDAAAILAAVCFALPAPVVAQGAPAAQRGIEVARQFVAAAEESTTAIDLRRLPGLPPGVLPTLHKEPRFGTFALQGLAATYTPQTGFFGNDSVTLASGASRWVLELRVLPRHLPFAGRWHGEKEAAALYDNATGSFLLCRPLASLEEPLDCDSKQLLEHDGNLALIPLAWPDRRNFLELPALFDPATGNLLILGEEGSGLAVREIVELKETAGGWPILGDWYGTGVRELAIVFGDGRVISRSSAVKWHAWPGQLPVPDPTRLAWPIRLPVEAERSALALVHPGLGHLIWMGLEPGGQATIGGVLDHHGVGNFLRPLTWVMAPSPDLEPSPQVFFLRQGRDGLELIFGGYGILEPQTIPVKFPDDPPGP